jgi:hypothetical protein
VIAHSVRTNRIDTKNQQKALAELQAQYHQLKGKVKFLRVTWKKKTLKDGRLSGPLLINVGTPEEANTLVSDGLIHDHEPKNCEIFHSECNMTQCYKCWACGHIAMTCRKPQTCGNCAKEHHSGSCPTPNNKWTHFCSNCKGKHTVWDQACPIRKAEAARAAAAYKTRPTMYAIVSRAPNPAQLLSLQFSPTPTPLPFTANQGQPAPPTRTIRKQARQSTAPAAGERAEDGSVAAPEQVGEMKGITPAPPQPPSSVPAPQTSSLPAFPAVSLSSTPTQTRPRVTSMMTARPQSPSSSL